MKKILLGLAAVLAVVSLTACQSAKPQDKSQSVKLDVEELAQELMQAGGMETSTALDAAALNLDESMVSAFAAYTSEETANRVYVFEVANSDVTDKVKYIGEKEQDTVINTFLPVKDENFEVAKTSRVLVNGKYVVFISVPKVDDAKAVFDSKFQ